jgi:Flp pilus assembly pilin Flp
VNRSLVRFLTDETGASLVEYALIIALVMVVAIAAVSYFGHVTANDLGNTANKI